MSPKKKTVADYVAISIAPLLIFLMLSSLANFLMLVIYRGGQPTKVSWTIMCFTLGTVAVARVSIEKDRSYSLAYAVVLGLVAYLAMARFIGSSIAVILLLALIAYLSDWVTRDCTLIDENADSSDQGLMESGQFTSLWKSLGHRNKEGRQPGRSVLYLAMAALPLYGIGQVFLRRGPMTWDRAQWLLLCYLFGAIALLVTTSFLGLRRYLRQRGTDMPKEVSLAWLIGGIVLTFLILMIAAFAPVPGQALASFQLPAFLDSPGDTLSSRFGWGKDGADQAQEGASSTSQDGRPEEKEIGSEATGENGEPGKAESGDNPDAPPGKESGGKQQASGQPSNESNESSESSESSEPNESSESGENQQSDASEPDKNSSNTEESSMDSPSEDSKGPDEGESKSENPESSDPEEGSETDQDSAQPTADSSESPTSSSPPIASSETPPSKPPPPGPSSPSSLPSITSLLRWIIFIVLFGFISRFVWKNRHWLMAWLNSLRGHPPKDGNHQDFTGEIEPLPSDKPFSAYGPPGEHTPWDEAIITTFHAFAAWSLEAGLPRAIKETPNEFLIRFSQQFPAMGNSAREVVGAYNRIAYGNGSATGIERSAADRLWQQMTT